MDQLYIVATRCAAIAALGLGLSTRLGAQGATLVVAAFDTTKWMTARQAIELRIAGEPLPSGSRIAVVLGSTDLSALLRATGDTLREVWRNTWKRALFVLISAGLAGYAAPVAAKVAAAMLPGAAQGPELGRLVAAIVGGGAQRIFAAFINRGVKQIEGGA